MKKPYAMVFLVLAGAAAAQTAAVRTPVPDPRPLMLAAIDSPSGQAYGVLTGQTAQAITHQFKATTPVYIDVTTVKRYAQPGCSRLSVRFWQDGVLLPGAAAPRTQTIEFGINYCRDGLPPRALS